AHRITESRAAARHRHQHVVLVDQAHDALALEHRELRDVVELEAPVGGEERIFRLHAHRGALLDGAADQVAQVAVPGALAEALIGEPVVVEHLREVLVAAVAHEGDDPLGLRSRAAVFERSSKQRAGGGSGEDALLREQLARHRKAFGVGDAEGFLHGLLRAVLVIAGVALADVGARHHDFRAERLQMEHFLLAHLVGDDEHQPVALARGNECQPESGVARGGLDDRAARLQLSIALGGLDHRESDAVLDRASGILALELEEKLARPGVEPRHLHERRVADERKDVAHSAMRRYGISEMPMSEMWKPFRCDRTSIASDTLCGSRVGPMVMRGIMCDIASESTDRIINSPARRSPVLEAVLNGAHRSYVNLAQMPGRVASRAFSIARRPSTAGSRPRAAFSRPADA